VDLWRSVDQSGNTPDTAKRNAVAAGVGDRVDLRTGDLIDLPLPDHGFEVVLSALAIHNIADPAGRDWAVDEAARTLRPGGRIVIVDILYTKRYATRLAEHGLTIRRRPLGWRYWYGGPWMAAHVITAHR
jgi:arsenite methyltransferase